MENVNKFKRIRAVLSILSKYGFDDLLSRSGAIKYMPTRFKQSTRGKEINTFTLHKRIRLALEELGPTYVKLGQMFSNREDILPPELIAELAELQDNVPPLPLNIDEYLTQQLSINVSDHFEYINPTPIASASISQVYLGRLINGQKIVIKVKRTGIEETIKSDILIMKDLASLFESAYEAAQKMNLKQVIRSFENNMKKELSLTNELHNIERFRKNFAENEQIYVPLTYTELSNNDVLTMKFVEGFKVNDKEKIIELGINPSQVSQDLISLYLKQILEDGFFHADPHPGNVFIMPDKRYCFIDFGSMGSMTSYEKELCASLIENFLLKNAKKIIFILKRLSINYEIQDERLLEKQVYDIFHMLEHTALNELNVTDVIAKLKEIMATNHVLMPEFVYLLMRGISILEGIGKQLNPQLNVMESLKPFAAKYAKQQFNPKKIAQKSLQNAKLLVDYLQNLPEDAMYLMEKVKDDKLTINHKVEGLEDMRKTVQNATNRLTYAIIIAALSIGSSILMMAEMPPLIYGNSVLGLLGFLISGILGLVIIYSIYKKDH